MKLGLTSRSGRRLLSRCVRATMLVVGAPSAAALGAQEASTPNEVHAFEHSRRVTDEELAALQTLLRGADADAVTGALDSLRSPALLAWIALRTEDDALRGAALARIGDELTLELVLREEPAMARHVLPRLGNPERLLRVLLEVPLEEEPAIAALERVVDPLHLHRIARDGPPFLRTRAIARLSNPDWLQAILDEERSLEERLAALERLDAPSVLERVASEEGPVLLRRAALHRIEDPRVRELIARTRGPERLRAEALFGVDAASVLDPLVGEGRLIGRVAALRLAFGEPVLRALFEARFDPGPMRIARPGEDAPGIHLELVSRATGERVLEVEVTSTLDVPTFFESLLSKVELGTREIASLARARSRHLRLACIRHGLDPATLAAVALEDPVGGLRVAALLRVADPMVLARVACEDELEAVALAALGRIGDPAALAEVALNASRGYLRRRATVRVRDPAVLSRIALEDPQAGNRAVAARQLDDPALLERIAIQDEERVVRYNAVATLRDRAALERIVTSGGTEGGLAACRLGLLDLEPSGQRLVLHIERDADDVLYRPGPDPIRVRGEWVRGEVYLTSSDGKRQHLATQNWTMPWAIALEMAEDWIDVEIDPEAFLGSVRAALEANASTVAPTRSEVPPVGG